MSNENGHWHGDGASGSLQRNGGSYDHTRQLSATPSPAATEAARNDGGSGRASADAALELGALWSALRQGWWIILLVTVVVVGGVAAYTLQMDEVYDAESVVSVDTRQTVTAFDQAPVVEQHALSSEAGHLQNSLALAERVVEKLRKTADAVGTDQHFPLLKDLEDTERTTRERALDLMGRMTFNPDGEQELIRIGVESTSPEEAASIANLYAEAYQRSSRENSRRRITAAKAFLQEQADKYEQRMERIQGRLARFAQEKQVVQQGRGGEALIAEYRGMQQKRDQAQFELGQEQASLRLLEQQLAQARPDLEGSVLQENRASGLQERIGEMNRRLAALNTQAEEYYAVDSTRRGRETDIEELETIKDRIQHFTERKEALTSRLVGKELRTEGEAGTGEGGPLGYVERLRQRIAETKLNISGLKSQIAAYDERLASYDGRLQNLPRQSIEREQIERNLAQAERWYNSFAERLQQVRVAEESELGYVEQVRKAVVPAVPVRPDLTQNLVLGLLLGLGFGTALSFAYSASDQRLKSPEDVEEQGYELLGVVPSMDPGIREDFEGRETVEVEGRQLSTSLVTLLNPWSPVAENFRLIKTNLHHTEAGNGTVRVLLVTSPSPSDGKSVTAANVAAAMAQGGKRTLLIDGDLRRARGHVLFGRDRSPGLADLLTGERPFRPEDFATSVERLSFIPAGEYDDPPGELFESARMEELMSGLRHFYDAIVVDSPPVLAVTDAMILAGYSDAAVVVVSANRTDASALRVTQDRLRAVGTHVAGTIINRVDPKSGAVGKGGYEYGYYQEYTADET